MLICATAKAPTPRELEYANAVAQADFHSRHPDQTNGVACPVIDRTTLLPQSQIVGMAYYMGPQGEDRASIWAPPPDYGLSVWKVRRALRFTQPIKPGWHQCQGEPKPIGSWGGCNRALALVQRAIQRQHYTWIM